ncbi:Golgi SNAP receptor complex member 1-like [Sycon ciliatum]|uniref:Golgi SNAP receptor complex member 1-like n=1 Tax=Sycon ciliatum TaxID=27933 RepID=UPI0031F628AF
MATSWEALRREARRLENEIDNKLTAFSRLGTGHHDDRRGSPTLGGSCDAVGMEISQLLQKLSTVNEALNEALGPDASSALLHTRQRHHDILQDYRQEFNKTKAHVHALQEREDLIGSVRQDINAHKTASGSMNRRTETYMKEHNHLQGSEKAADEALGVAMGARESLSSQRRLLSSINSQVTGLSSRFPALNSLMQRINFRKRRDSIILGSVIAGCIILLILYSWS